MASKPTQRSLQLCRQSGWPVQVVEKWNVHAGIRQDLFGCIDIVALDEMQGIRGIQACAGGDVSKRLAKAVNHPLDKDGVPLDPWPLRRWLERGNRFQVWGWREVVAYRKDGSKAARKAWEVRVVNVTLADLQSP